ncbi:MAG: hypothetical protein ACI3YH_07690 [Eubacteriales bacterium]
MKKTVFNDRIITPLLFAMAFILLGIGCLVYLDTDIVEAVVMFIIAAGFLNFLLLQPICFVFEKDKLTVRYFFGFHEIIYWEKVQKMIFYSTRTLFPLFHSVKYQFMVEGGTQGKKASFTTGEVPANKKTSECIAKFIPEGLIIADGTE